MQLSLRLGPELKPSSYNNKIEGRSYACCVWLVGDATVTIVMLTWYVGLYTIKDKREQQINVEN